MRFLMHCCYWFKNYFAKMELSKTNCLLPVIMRYYGLVRFLVKILSITVCNFSNHYLKSIIASYYCYWGSHVGTFSFSSTLKLIFWIFTTFKSSFYNHFKSIDLLHPFRILILRSRAHPLSLDYLFHC